MNRGECARGEAGSTERHHASAEHGHGDAEFSPPLLNYERRYTRAVPGSASIRKLPLMAVSERP